MRLSAQIEPPPALREAAAAVRARPDDPRALAVLAGELAAAGHATAPQVLARALRAGAAEAVSVLADPALLLEAGVTLGQAEQLPAALLALERATALDPGLARAWLNRGVALCKLERFEEALACTRAAVALEPGCAEAEFGSAVALLALGRWREGFAGYEARWRLPGAVVPAYPSSRWRGEALAGRTLLVHGEQGFGDMLHFARFVPLVARDGPVVLEVPQPLHRLLGRLPGVAGLALPGKCPPHDLHVPLLSLPGLLGTTPQTVPPAPYLEADPQGFVSWRARLPVDRRPLVGLVWAGGGRRDGAGTQQPDGGRSIPPAALAPLAGAAVCFVSLQVGESTAGLPFPALDAAHGVRDFADTAAVMAALDLVISVDTAAAHLAGGLGRPVWLLRRFAADWRFPGPERSPWYSSLRVFRQLRPGDWAGVIEAVAAALGDWAREPRG
jgi:hypothetical protein